MGSKGVLNIRGWDYPNGTITYTLWQTYEKLLKIAISFVDLPMKNDLPEGNPIPLIFNSREFPHHWDHRKVVFNIEIS